MRIIAGIISRSGRRLLMSKLTRPGQVTHPDNLLQLRNLQSLVEIGVDKNTTVVFPAPLMTTIAELGSFLECEQAAAAAVLLPSDDGKLARVTAASATVPNGTAGPR